MLLAELEVRHSRAVVPTRRVALGDRRLPAEPPPGPGGILLGGLVAAHVDAIDDDLLAFLRERRGAGLPWRGLPTDIRWALRVLGFAPESDPRDDDVRRRFRSLVRDVHPDHGGDHEGAGLRVLELTEARRILLS